MQERSFRRMSSDNVEEFDVRIIESQDLLVSIVLVHAPWSVTPEQYQINQHTKCITRLKGDAYETFGCRVMPKPLSP